MKKEWQRLDRLYSGIKFLSARPTAVVVIDTNVEKSAIRECRKIKVPLVGIVDSNCDPESVDYAIPGNDDALGSLNLIIGTLADAVLEGNKGNGIKHNLKDYAKVEIKITKTREIKEEEQKIDIPVEEENKTESFNKKEEESKTRSRSKVKGILERVKEEAATKKEVAKPKTKAVKTKTEEAPKKKAVKKPAAKSTTKKAKK